MGKFLKKVLRLPVLCAMSVDMLQTGSDLREFRKKTGDTQVDFAAKVDYSPAHIGKLETIWKHKTLTDDLVKNIIAAYREFL